MKSVCGQIRVSHTARGLTRYEIEVRHNGLRKYQLIRGDDQDAVAQKAQAKMEQWDAIWDRQRQAEDIQEKRSLAAELTDESKAALDALDNILLHTLKINDAVDWESLKTLSDYPEPQPAKPELPAKPAPLERPKQPSRADFIPKLGILDRIVSSRRAAREREALEGLRQAIDKWKKRTADEIAFYNAQAAYYNKKVKELSEQYKNSLAAWRQRRSEHLHKRDQANAAIDKKKQEYLARDPVAIVDYCDMVLSHSQYPDFFPQSYELEYSPDNRILIVDYDLPLVDRLPTVKEIAYVQTKDTFEEKHLSQAEISRRYDSVLYQVALRTIHELYEADLLGALESIVFNGYVHSVDMATGKEIHPCVLSLQAGREEFREINLLAVEPKACFKKLKGVGSSRLHSMTPVAPVLRMNREDRRFIEGRAVVDGIPEGDNLAAMDWEDFEHLIRELFEKEFAQAGGEVKVTRASRDGGVDAVVFDPDPLRGGKIVIQAKRYTNTVGVSAVRDLYGTLMNEGANKGILVCTSDYGPDAYEFARGKPLVLLSGGELLHLLEKHGHRARIDLAEAKLLLSEEKKT